MTLGDLIARLTDAGVAEQALAKIGDASLCARVSSAADAAGVSIGEYAVRSVRSFADGAEDGAWLALIGRSQTESDPGLAALAYILERGLPRGEAHP